MTILKMRKSHLKPPGRLLSPRLTRATSRRHRAARPRGDLSSTGYAQANPGEEYLLLEPDEKAEPFTVRLAAGTYALEWFDVDSREVADGGEVTVESAGPARFSAPFAAAGPVVLCLKKVGA